MFQRLHRPLPASLKIIQQLNFLAAYNYTPRLYHGRVSLFSATGDLTAANDLQEGWRVLGSLGVEVHEIPGDHINIIKEPHVRTLAEKLNECLESAEDLPKQVWRPNASGKSKGMTVLADESASEEVEAVQGVRN